jgi:hypothetical protein
VLGTGDKVVSGSLYGACAGSRQLGAGVHQGRQDRQQVVLLALGSQESLLHPCGPGRSTVGLQEEAREDCVTAGISLAGRWGQDPGS